MNKLFNILGIWIINPIYLLLYYLFKFDLKDDWMMNKKDEIKLLSSFNSWLLVNGKNKSLSLEESYKHLALISRTGGGKTTSYVLPNIYKLADENCSMIITDLSWEIYEKTSWFLNKKNFKIKVLNPSNLEESIRYNPLNFATNSIEIDSISEILISSSGLRWEKADERIWSDWAKNFLSILIKVLKNKWDKKFINLSNIRYMINNFWERWEYLEKFIEKYSNEKILNEFKGFINGNEKTIQGFITTLNIALSPIWINDSLEKLTYFNNFDFKQLREEKTVVYIKIEQQYQEQYSFLLNLFYSQLFNEMMKNIPQDKNLAIFCLLDEFWNMNIPKFSTIITSIRKYKVSLSIILQNIRQLNDVYWENKAKTILDGGVSSKLIYSGSDLELATNLEKLFWTKNILNQYENWKYYLDKQNVMSIRDIRTMRDNKAIFIYANKNPLKLDIKPYYKNSKYLSYSKIKPYKIKELNYDENIEYVDLRI